MNQRVWGKNWQKQSEKWEVIKYIIKWVGFRVGFGVVFSIWFLYGNSFSSYAAEEGEPISNESETGQEPFVVDLLILFDDSKSMNKEIANTENQDTDTLHDENAKVTYGDMATEWAQDICALLVDSNIEVSVAFFDDQYKIQVEPTKITSENLKNITTHFSDAQFQGAFTNHNVAMKEAEELLKGRDTKHKYIVLISDGDLDLYEEQDMTDEEREECEKEENDEELAFCNKCEELAQLGEYTVILIGLGNDIDLYKKIDTNLDNIKCWNNKEDLKELKLLLLDAMGIDLVPLNVEDNSFVIDNDYDTCVIHMKYRDNAELANKEIQKEDFHLYYMEDGQGAEADFDKGELIEPKMLPTSTGNCLYLVDPEKGRYIVDFPKGFIQVDCIEKRVIEEVKLILADEDGNAYAGTEVNNCIRYSLEKQKSNENLNVVIKIDTEKPTGATAKYYLKEINILNQNEDYDAREGGQVYQELSYNYSSNSWEGSLAVESGKEYACIAIVDTKIQGECKSNKIVFTVPERDTVVSELTIEGNVGEIFGKDTYIPSNYQINELTIQLIKENKEEQNLVEKGIIKDTIEPIQIDENFNIKFLQEGEYVIHFRVDNSLVAKGNFKIKTDPIPNFFELCKQKTVVIVIVGIIVIVLLLLFIFLK